jgi:ribosomal protein S1
MNNTKNLKEKVKHPHLYTSKDLQDPFSNPFKTESERIAYMKKHYGDMPLAKSFSVFYGERIETSTIKSKKVNNPVTIELGNVYYGNVESISPTGIEFSVPGVKNDIVSKENFMDCIDNVRNYLLNHDNELAFTVIEKKNNKYIVSVIDGYYRLWEREIERCIKQHYSIQVHIDSLARNNAQGYSGYIGSTSIWTINEVTGKNYTSAVFIPGSNIVLNIETNFERWVGQDVEVVPQKFTKFRSAGKPVENSIIGSRKMVLKILGMKNLFEIWHRMQLASKPGVKYTPEIMRGKVTGIINSNKKSGVFVEIEDKYFTGLMPVDSSQLLDYRAGDYIDVYISEFETIEGQDPFYIDKQSVIRKCNVRPVLARA